jgi:hypothetical protein
MSESVYFNFDAMACSLWLLLNARTHNCQLVQHELEPRIISSCPRQELDIILLNRSFFSVFGVYVRTKNKPGLSSSYLLCYHWQHRAKFSYTLQCCVPTACTWSVVKINQICNLKFVCPNNFISSITSCGPVAPLSSLL